MYPLFDKKYSVSLSVDVTLFGLANYCGIRGIKKFQDSLLLENNQLRGCTSDSHITSPLNECINVNDLSCRRIYCHSRAAVGNESKDRSEFNEPYCFVSRLFRLCSEKLLQC